MTERAAHSPSEQAIFRGNWLERAMLKRISRLALRLPEEFDERDWAGSPRVHGQTTGLRTVIKLEELLGSEEDNSTQFTDITIDRYSADTSRLADLAVDRCIGDDAGDIYGLSREHQTFALGEDRSELSILDVMRSVSLAVRTVEGAKTLEYLANHPEPGQPQGQNLTQPF